MLEFRHQWILCLKFYLQGSQRIKSSIREDLLALLCISACTSVPTWVSALCWRGSWGTRRRKLVQEWSVISKTDCDRMGKGVYTRPHIFFCLFQSRIPEAQRLSPVRALVFIQFHHWRTKLPGCKTEIRDTVCTPSGERVHLDNGLLKSESKWSNIRVRENTGPVLKGSCVHQLIPDTKLVALQQPP